LILEELWKIEINDMLRFGISVAIILGCLAYAHSAFLQKFRFLLVWLSQGMGILNDLVDWIFLPIKALFDWIFRGASSKVEP
jgi:hypothetical protein